MWENTSTVIKSTYNSNEIYFVGVGHLSIQSADLAEEVIRSASPNCICIESCPERYSRGSKHELSGFASSRALSYARSTGNNIALVDDCVSEYESIISDIPNENVPQPDTDGNFDRNEIIEFRTTIKKLDRQVYDKIVIQRERNIAGRIKYIMNRADGPFVAILGAAHIEEIPELISTVDEIELSSSRLIN